jgi:hypothetical protein
MKKIHTDLKSYGAQPEKSAVSVGHYILFTTYTELQHRYSTGPKQVANEDV